MFEHGFYCSECHASEPCEPCGGEPKQEGKMTLKHYIVRMRVKKHDTNSICLIGPFANEAECQKWSDAQPPADDNPCWQAIELDEADVVRPLDIHDPRWVEPDFLRGDAAFRSA
jgi:hypothetical protein